MMLTGRLPRRCQRRSLQSRSLCGCCLSLWLSSPHNTRECPPKFLHVPFAVSNLSRPMLMVLLFIQRMHFLELLYLRQPVGVRSRSSISPLKHPWLATFSIKPRSQRTKLMTCLDNQKVLVKVIRHRCLVNFCQIIDRHSLQERHVGAQSGCFQVSFKWTEW